MKKLLVFLVILSLVLVLALALAGCTQQDRAKRFGGTATVDLPQGEKLVMATWKDVDLWYLTRPMKPGDVAEEYRFRENSKWGVLQGTVILKEHK